MQRIISKYCKEDLTFMQMIQIDRKLNSTKSFLVLLIYRIYHYLYVHDFRFAKMLWGGVKSVVYFLLRIDAQISYKSEIGHSIRLPHSAMGVVISSKAIIGNNVTIYHHVTIGVNENKPDEKKKVIVKDNCYLSTGCKVISCVLNENCKIAPNAVVYKDLPANTMCYPLNEVKLLSNSVND